MLKVTFGKQTLGRSLEEFLSGFSNFKNDVPSFEMYWHGHWACCVKSQGDYPEGAALIRR